MPRSAWLPLAVTGTARSVAAIPARPRPETRVRPTRTKPSATATSRLAAPGPPSEKCESKADRVATSPSRQRTDEQHADQGMDAPVPQAPPANRRRCGPENEDSGEHIIERKPIGSGEAAWLQLSRARRAAMPSLRSRPRGRAKKTRTSAPCRARRSAWWRGWPRRRTAPRSRPTRSSAEHAFPPALFTATVDLGPGLIRRERSCASFAVFGPRSFWNTVPS